MNWAEHFLFCSLQSESGLDFPVKNLKLAVIESFRFELFSKQIGGKLGYGLSAVRLFWNRLVSCLLCLPPQFEKDERCLITKVYL